MEVHPFTVKAMLSLAAGLFVGLESMGPKYLVAIEWTWPVMVALAVAMTKGFLVGGATWLGQTIIAFITSKLFPKLKRKK